MISETNGGNITHAPQYYCALAVLGRFFGIGVIQLPGWPGDYAKRPGDQVERFGLRKLAGHDQYNVVRLIIFFVKRLQIVDRNPLDVAAIADGGFSVVVPVVSSR